MPAKRAKASLAPPPPPRRRRFKLIAMLSKHFSCTICSDVLLQPMVLPCGHTYCQPCLNDWLPKNSSCPECRQPVRTKDPITNRVVAQFIQAQEMYCHYPGCTWTDTLEKLEEHEKTCLYEPSRIPSWIKKDIQDDVHKQEAELDSLQMLNPEQADIKASLQETIPQGSLRQRLFMKSQALRDKISEAQDGHTLHQETNLEIQQEKALLQDIIGDLPPDTEDT